MPVRAPADIFETNCHRWEATGICKSTYCIYINISLPKTKTINTKTDLSLEQLRMNNMQRTSAIELFFLQSCASVVLPQLLSEPAPIYLILTTCFYGGMMANFDNNVYIIAREKWFYLCKISRTPYGIRLISYNAGLTPYDVVRCSAGHRPMISYTDAGRRP